MSAASPRRLPPALVIGVAVLALAAGALWAVWTVRSGAAPPAAGGADLDAAPPILQELPEFRLTASDGTEVSLASLAGGPWVVDFIFTTCAGVCPQMSSRLARLQDQLPADHPARLVSITVDPGHDTPEVLAEYAERYGARTDRWIFLTGAPEEIYRLARDGFRLAAGPLPEFDPTEDDGPFFHSRRVVLVDAAGRVRGYYDGTDAAAMERLRTDLERVAGGGRRASR